MSGLRMKILTLLATVVALASSVAAVSAFESHMVNVEAKVENALKTPTNKIDFNTVFPEEWLVKDLAIEQSSSFKGAGNTRVSKLDIQICASPKPSSFTGKWMGGFTYINIAGTGNQAGADFHWVGPTADFTAPTTTGSIVCPSELLITLDKNVNAGVLTIKVAIDVPVDPDFYHEATDVCDKPRPATHENNNLSTVTTGFPVDGTQTTPVPCQRPSIDPPLDYTANGDAFGIELTLQIVKIY